MNIDAVCEYLKEYARYVAPNAMSVNPHAVLAMIAEIERLREENDMLRKEVERRLDQERVSLSTSDLSSWLSFRKGP